MPFFILPSANRPVETINRVSHSPAFGEESPGILRFGPITQLSDIRLEPEAACYRFERQTVYTWLFVAGKGYLKTSHGPATEVTAGDQIQIHTGSGTSWSLINPVPTEPLFLLEIQSLPSTLFPVAKFEKNNNLSFHQNRWSTFSDDQFTYYSASFLPFEESSLEFFASTNGMLIRILQGSVMIGGDVVSAGDWIGVYDFNRIQFMPQSLLQLLVIELPLV